MTEQLFMLDWQKFMSTLPDMSVDLIITDPPYWTLNKWREMGTTTRLGGHHDADKRDESKWFQTIDENELIGLMADCWRVLKNNSHMYLFCDDEVSDYVKRIARGMAWSKAKRLVWDKVNQGMGYTYRCRYEFIILLQKGNLKLNDLGIPDVLQVKKISNGYPTEKPVPLMKILIKQSSIGGGIVCDPFFGSGNVGAACKMLDRSFIGNDISPAAHEYYKNKTHAISMDI